MINKVEVLRKNYDKEYIKIAFNPIEEKFEVCDAAITRNKAYISDISILWDKNIHLFQIAEQYLSDISESKELVKGSFNKLTSVFSPPIKIHTSCESHSGSLLYMR